MSVYKILESDQFLEDVEEAAVWIFLNNVEQSEAQAEKKVDELQAEIELLKERLSSFPESGENDVIRDVRKFPVYGGRYSVIMGGQLCRKKRDYDQFIRFKTSKRTAHFFCGVKSQTCLEC